MRRSFAVGTGSWDVIDGDGVRVLVVEDHPDTLELFAEVLRIRGYAVEVANDGDDAVAKAATFRPHLVLLDLGLPTLDGYEVAAAVRAANPDVRIVAVTGYGRPGDRHKTRAAGFDAHLTKPVAMQNIFDALADARRRRDEHDTSS